MALFIRSVLYSEYVKYVHQYSYVYSTPVSSRETVQMLAVVTYAALFYHRYNIIEQYLGDTGGCYITLDCSTNIILNVLTITTLCVLW